MREKHDVQADLEMVREALAGSRDGLERLGRRMRCVPRMLAAHNARLGGALDDHDLADLCQDCLLVVWKKLNRFEGRSPFEGWVYRICALELMNGIRRKARARSTAPLSHADASLSESAADPWEHEDLHRALERLPGAESEVVRLKHFEELTFEEIGEFLGMSPNTAKTRYYRGLESLSGALSSRNVLDGSLRP